MALFDNIDLPDTPALAVVRKYLEAQERADLSRAHEFFADDIVFNGLILRAEGRETVAAQIEGFIKQAIESLELEYVAEVESGKRVLALYNFKLRPLPNAHPLCDHITIRDGKIARIDNVFDLRKIPPM
jgi:ketosteroid isomerase-like protein